MIFYGTKGSNLFNGKIINTNCSHCNEVATMTYSVFAKYAHIYWIPVFPYKKLTFVECNNCKMTFEQKEFSGEITTKLEREKEKNGKKMFPLWMFSGAIIILALSGFGVYQSNVDDNNEKIYIQNPAKGDIYHIKLDDDFYTAATVISTDKDSVYLRFSNLETDQMTGIDEISKPKNFIMGKYGYKRERLKELFEKDTIYTIDRN